MKTRQLPSCGSTIPTLLLASSVRPLGGTFTSIVPVITVLELCTLLLRTVSEIGPFFSSNKNPPSEPVISMFSQVELYGGQQVGALMLSPAAWLNPPMTVRLRNVKFRTLVPP